MKARVENESHVIFSVPLSFTPDEEDIKNNGSEAIFGEGAMDYILAAPADTSLTVPRLIVDKRRVLISVFDLQGVARLKVGKDVKAIHENSEPTMLNGIVFEYQMPSS